MPALAIDSKVAGRIVIKWTEPSVGVFENDSESFMFLPHMFLPKIRSGGQGVSLGFIAAQKIRRPESRRQKNVRQKDKNSESSMYEHLIGNANATDRRSEERLSRELFHKEFATFIPKPGYASRL